MTFKMHSMTKIKKIILFNSKDSNTKIKLKAANMTKTKGNSTVPNFSIKYV